MTHFVHSWGYLAVLVLTIAEAACVPIPSEVTVGVAGYLASTGRLNLVAVILLGTAGETLGATIAYWVGRTGGRALVERFGRYLLLTHDDLDRAQRWFEHRGEWSVAVGRVVPLVRTFIALPAGVAEMAPIPFTALTAAGSLVWIGSLAGTAYALGGSWTRLTRGFTLAGYLLAALVVVAIILFIAHRWQKMRAGGAKVGAVDVESVAEDA